MSSSDPNSKWSQQRAKDYQAHPIDPQKVNLTSDEIGTRSVADLVSRDVPRDEIPSSALHSSATGAGTGSGSHVKKEHASGPGMAKALGVGIDLDDRGVAATTMGGGAAASTSKAAVPAEKKGGFISNITNLTASDPARGLTASDLTRGDNLDTASRYSGVRNVLGAGAAGAAGSNACGCSGDLLPDHYETHHPGWKQQQRSCDCTGDLLPDHWQTHHSGGMMPSSTASTRPDLTTREQIPDQPESEHKSLGQKIGAALGLGGKKKKNKKNKKGTSTSAPAAAGTAAAAPLPVRQFGSNLGSDSNVVSGADMSAGQGLHREANLETAPRQSVASTMGLNDPRATQAAIDALPAGINDIKLEGTDKLGKTHHRRHDTMPAAPARARSPVRSSMPAPTTTTTTSSTVVMPPEVIDTQSVAAPPMRSAVNPADQVYVESIQTSSTMPLYNQPQAPVSERVIDFPPGSSTSSQFGTRDFQQQQQLQGGQPIGSSSFGSDSTQQQFGLGQSQSSSTFSQQQPFGSTSTSSTGSLSDSSSLQDPQYQQSGGLRNQQF